MKKRVLSILLVLCMATALLPLGTVTARAVWITSDHIWNETTIDQDYQISSSATVTIHGCITVEGNVTISGGTIARGNNSAYFSIGEGDSLTLDGVTVDGRSISSNNSMFDVDSGTLKLQNNSTVKNCVKNDYSGGAINVNGGTLTIENTTITNCSSTYYGGAIYLTNAAVATIESGTFSSNKTTDTTSNFGGGFIYNLGSTLTIEGGNFTDNTSAGRGGAIYNGASSSSTSTKTYILGGVFSGNTSTRVSYEGSGAVFCTYASTGVNELYISGNVQFGNGSASNGMDGVYLGSRDGALRKALITSALQHPVNIYVECSEGRVIAEGAEGYTLTASDMEKIKFHDAGNSGVTWYPWLDSTGTNVQVKVSQTEPRYVIYDANGAAGSVTDNNVYTSEINQVTVKSGDELHYDGHTFTGWNTKADGTGTPYQPNDMFNISKTTTLYAQWREIESYNVWVGGVQVTADNASDVLGDADGDGATVTYNAGTKTLTLNDAYITDTESVPGEGYAAILSYDDLNIVLAEGSENTITLTGSDILTGVTSVGEGGLGTDVKNITVSGNGSLNINITTGNAVAFGVMGSAVTIDGGAAVDVTVDGTSTEQMVAYIGIMGYGGVAIKNSTVTATVGKGAGNNIAIMSTGAVTIDNAEVTASGYTGIMGMTGISITGESTVKAKGTGYAIASGQSNNITFAETLTAQGRADAEAGDLSAVETAVATADGTDNPYKTFVLSSDASTVAKYVEISRPGHTHDGIIFSTEWSKSIVGQTITNNTNIILTDNVTVEGSSVIITGTTVNLCLNGHSISSSVGNGTFRVGEGGVLNVYDCQEGVANTNGQITETGGHNPVYLHSGGTMNLYSGKISSTRSAIVIDEDPDANINNIAGGTVNIYGGEVSSSGASYQAIKVNEGLAVSTTIVNIEGGSVISENYAIMAGSGKVYLSGNPTISGGEDKADISIATSSSELSAEIHAKSQNDNEYTSGALALEIKNISSSMAGKTIVFGTIDTGDFTIYNDEDNKFCLYADSANGNLNLHQHDWSTVWTSNSTAHWHECTASCCPITDDTQKGGYATHSALDDDGNCTTAVTCATCGYELTEAQSHNLSYSSQYNVITEKCENGGCNHTATATISAPNGTLTYDGTTNFTATVTYSDGWAGGQDFTISYTKDSVSTTDTKGAGSYTASITIGTVTAQVSYTVNKAEVDVPTISSKEYSGSNLTADISNTADYMVIQNDGGTNVGVYSVVLKLIDSANYKWKTAETEEIPLTFSITSGKNEWTTTPNIDGWTYDETANEPTGAAKYGTVEFTYYNSDKGLLSEKPTNAGDYYMKATVAADENNYEKIESDLIPFTIAKASQTAPADGVGFVIDYDKETITANTGYELSTSNGTEATGSDSLTLTPGTDVYIRLKGDNDHDPSGWTKVTISPRPTAPEAPTVTQRTPNSITVEAVKGQEYRLGESGIWQDNGVFEDLEPGETYTVYTRVKAVTDVNPPDFASKISNGTTVSTVSTTGSNTVAVGETITTDNGTKITNDGNTVTVEPQDGEQTIITKPENDDSVTVDADGDVSVPEGGTVQTGSGTEITLPGGGTVDPTTGNVTPNEGGSVTIEDTDDNTTTITPPNGEAVTPNDDSSVKVPDGSTVKTEDGTEITIGDNNDGDTTVGTDGSINLPNDGTVETTNTAGETTTVTAPNGGEVKDDGNGITVPEGGTVQTGSGTEITLPGGGTVDPTTGNVTPNEGGSVTIEDTDDNTTTITPPNGEAVTPNDDSSVKVPDGSTVQTGNGPEITIGDNNDDTTVGTDGSINLPGGGSATVTDDDNTTTTTITAPEDGGEVKDDGNGNITIPQDGTVQTGNGTEITLPSGGTVDPTTGNVTPNEGGSVTIGDTDGNTTTITPPNGEAVTPNDDSSVKVPDGSTVKTGNGPEITIGDNNDGNTTVSNDGSVNLPGGGSATVTESWGDEFTVTVPDGGGAITTGDDGSVILPGGSTVVDADGNTTEIPEDGGVIEPGGDLSYDVTVTFDSQEGTEVAAQTIKVNQKVAEPEAPTRSGYSFQGWYTADGVKWDFDDPVTGSMTLYARWSRNSSGTTYQPIITDSENGTTTVSPSRPAAGVTVTITTTPDEGYEVEKVVVADRNGNEIEVTANEDGTYSFRQPTGSVTITVTYGAGKCDGTVADNCPSLAFDDLDTGMWYHEYVDYAIENGLMVGTGDATFSPDGTTTRAQAVTILWRMEGSPVVNYLMGFSDVAEGIWYTEAVRWAASEGIVLGTSDTTFSPDDPVTREQLAAILYRYAAYKEYDVSIGENTNILSFTDASEISDWAYEAMQWACGTELMQGNGDGTVNPAGNTRRCEFATMIMRFLEDIAK